MRKVTYAMGMSADGYIVGPDGGFAWSAPDDELFQHHTDQIRDVGVHLLGRKLYETMLYWEDVRDDPTLDDANRSWTALWNALPKVVFSRTLAAVRAANSRLATASLVDEIERLRAESEAGDIAIGGASLAAEAAAYGLIDEYHVTIHPVLVGGGLPLFAHDRSHVDLELVGTRTFPSQVIYLHYRVRR